MKTETYYRIAVNKNSELYSHFEPCGTDLSYAEKEFNKVKKECEKDDTVELQKDENLSGNWVTIK
jgi:hypothetical protein